MQKLEMQKLEKLLEEQLKNADGHEKDYLKELLRVVRFSSASKYYNHV